MKFNNESEKLMELLLPLYKKHIKSYSPDKKLSAKTNTIIEKLYRDIVASEKYVDKLKKQAQTIQKPVYKQELFEISSTNGKINKNDIPKSELFSSSFLPQTYREYILKNSVQYLVYTCEILKKKSKIYFVLFDKNENLAKYDQYASHMFSWLFIATKYSKKICAKTLTVYIYLTPFKKMLPNDRYIVINKEHVNSAVTTSCTTNGEIMLYRSEEWFKVFIHETFHIFGLDFSDYNSDNLSLLIKKLFPIKKQMRFYETYTETYAEIINCLFYSYNLLEDKSDFTSFTLYAEYCLEFEKIFSVIQVIKILNFMGLEYFNLYDNSSQSVSAREYLYREKTDVFAYYILKCILIHSYPQFLIWCNENNTKTKNGQLLKFRETPDNLRSFYELIEQSYDLKSLHELFQISKDFLNETSEKKIKNKGLLFNTMRMSICDFF
tara:strand:+ start:270 stop:1580 length:1311 start_codon:yes stop_codon:yes gene_type:complete